MTAGDLNESGFVKEVDGLNASDLCEQKYGAAFVANMRKHCNKIIEMCSNTSLFVLK